MRFVPILTLLSASLLGAQVAQADIYTWVDGNGVVNVSNLTPPRGADVTNVTVERAQAPAARNDAARDAAREAEVRALSDRVRELESDAQNAPRPAATTIIAPIYVPVPTPVMMPYQPEMMPMLTQQPGCDPSWYGCLASTTGFYGPGVIVLPSTGRRHVRPPKPVNAPVVWPRGNLAALGPWAPSVVRNEVRAHLPAPRP